MKPVLDKGFVELDPKKAIFIEKRRYGKTRQLSPVFHFVCSQCPNIIKVERKCLNKTTGKCTKCAHRGLPFEAVFNHVHDGILKTNKKRRKQKSFELTFEEFLEFTKITRCHYCNNIIVWKPYSRKGAHRSNLDRKDSSKGYIKNNLVVCCKSCNIMKGESFSYEEFIEVVNLLDRMRPKGFIFKG